MRILTHENEVYSVGRRWCVFFLEDKCAVGGNKLGGDDFELIGVKGKFK